MKTLPCPFLSARISLKTVVIYITDRKVSQFILETNCAAMHTPNMEGSDWLVRHSPLHRNLLQSKNELTIISENVHFSLGFSGKLSGSAQFFSSFSGKAPCTAPALHAISTAQMTLFCSF